MSLGQDPRPESERNLSQDLLAALDAQRAKEAAELAPASYIVSAISQLIGAHLAVRQGAPIDFIRTTERHATELLAKALAQR